MPTARTKRPAPATASPTTREPVLDGDHPLSVASPTIPGDDLSHTASSSIEAPVAATDEASIILEDEPDDEGGSDRDAALTDGEVSSVDGVSVYAPPDLADFVLLDHLSCRAPTAVSIARGGLKERCVCGKTTSSCLRNQTCHELAGVGLTKNTCPLLEVVDAQKARAIAKQAIALFAEHPTGPFLEVMTGVRGRMSKHNGAWIQLSS
jgi:hypothetical protein